MLTGKPHKPGYIARMTLAQIADCDDFRGCWVALDACRYDETTGKATEGSVVDADEDLVELCQRLRQADRRNCALVYCDECGRAAVS